MTSGGWMAADARDAVASGAAASKVVVSIG
jgi:hypothetical protein